MKATSEPVRILVADDHRLFAEALTAILDCEERLQCVGLAADGREAVQKAGELHPHVVVMDVDMPVLDGIEAARRVRAEHPDVAVLMLSGSSAEQDVARAREAGAAGYVTKDAIAANLVDAIIDAAVA